MLSDARPSPPSRSGFGGVFLRLDWTDWGTFALFAVTAVLTRLPFFYPDVIEWDESTFLLMGQGLLDGDLPYTNLWELKPPTLFALFAGIVALAGKSIPLVRLCGALFVALSAVFLTLFCKRRLGSPQAGVFAGLLFVVYSSLTKSQGAVTTEIAALPFLCAALLALPVRLEIGRAFVLGMLIALAASIRPNLVYLAALLCPAFLFWGEERTGVWTARLRAWAFYCLGGGTVIAAMTIPFLIAGRFESFYSAVVGAALSYSGEQMDPATALVVHVKRMFGPAKRAATLLLAALFSTGCALCLVNLRREGRERLGQYLGLGTFVAATALSILKTGEAYEHYLIQLLPGVCVLAGLAPAALGQTLPVGFGFGAALFLIAFSASAPGYATLSARLHSGLPLAYGPAYDMVQRLQCTGYAGEPLYAMHLHIVHFLTGTKPIAKTVTHPSAIRKEFVLKHIVGRPTTTLAELTAILDVQPVYILKHRRDGYLRDAPEALELLRDRLRTRYTLDFTTGDYELWRLKPADAARAAG